MSVDEQYASADEAEGLAGALIARIASSDVQVGVVGLGYVGLPLVQLCCRQNFGVIGFDIDETKVDLLNSGTSYIGHIASETIVGLLKDHQFAATTDFDRISDVDVIIVCVPTPLTRHREPDLSAIVATAEAIATRLRPGQLVVLESSTFPGTTDEVMKPILEKSGLIAGVDFFLAYSPEREDPGNKTHTAQTTPKVVGADGADALGVADALYSKIIDATVVVSNSRTAEAVKLTENIFRSVNIALVNELKIIFDKMDIDVWEVIDAAASKPFGFMPFYPGPGLGGHCIPIDPFYLTWKAREFGVPTRFIELAGEINTNMPSFVMTKLTDALNDNFERSIKGSRVLILGIAYKRDVDDMRESPSLVLIERLETAGAKVDFHDPFIPTVPHTREHDNLSGRQSVELTADALESYDAVMIVTDHTPVDYKLVSQHARLLIDTRNKAYRGADAKAVIIKA
ncbi:MAG: UDP-N-acetyl-D-glucosamine dehydrogenase [Rhodobiaceae bacterium]|nr:MAG: UDP-N-acetyl-D-glucosamine dehydrogenase [Rhodobiaceae bacterium]